MHNLALFELALASGCPQGRPSAQDDQQLLGAVVRVVDHEVAAFELVQGGAKEWASSDQPLRSASAAGPILRLFSPLVVPDVHSGDFDRPRGAVPAGKRGDGTTGERSRMSPDGLGSAAWREAVV